MLQNIVYNLKGFVYENLYEKIKRLGSDFHMSIISL